MDLNNVMRDARPMMIRRSVGAAGRKFDEDKHKRDIKGRWAKKHAGVKLSGRKTGTSAQVAREWLCDIPLPGVKSVKIISKSNMDENATYSPKSGELQVNVAGMVERDGTIDDDFVRIVSPVLGQAEFYSFSPEKQDRIIEATDKVDGIRGKYRKEWARNNAYSKDIDIRNEYEKKADDVKYYIQGLPRMTDLLKPRTMDEIRDEHKYDKHDFIRQVREGHEELARHGYKYDDLVSGKVEKDASEQLRRYRMAWHARQYGEAKTYKDVPKFKKFHEKAKEYWSKIGDFGATGLTGVKSVDALLGLLNNLGAAGTRKYDENKHKRDAIGQYAKKEGEGPRPADDDNPYQFDMENFKKLIDYDDIETTHNFERRVREFKDSIHDILYTNESTPVNLVLFQNPEAYTSLGVTRGDLQNVFGGNDMHVWNGEPQLLAIIRDEKEKLLEHFPQLERYVELYDVIQKAMDIGYDRRFNDTDALYRGTDINELDTILRAGMGSGGGFPYANFSIYHEQATEFSLQQDDPIIIKLPKEENREHIVSPGYVLDQSGDNHEGDIVGPRGYDYFYEHEHRIRTDKDVNLGIEVLLRNYGGAEDEFKNRMKERYPFVKKFHFGEWEDW